MKKLISIAFVVLLLFVIAGCVETPESCVRDGNTKMMTHDYDEAIDFYNKAIKLDESNIEAHYQIGRALYFKGEKIKACDYFAKVKKLDENGEYARRSQEMLEKIWAELRKEGKLK